MSSFVLNTLKSVQEQLDKNYSSRQLLATLDTLLLCAIKPIITKTRFVDRQLSLLCGWYTNAARRKVASLGSKERFISLVVAFIASNSNSDRIKIFQALKLERTLTFWIVQNWLDSLKGWPEAIAKLDFATAQSYERRACVVDNQATFQNMQKVEYWLSKAVAFKHQLMEKYMRYAMVEAQAYYAYHRKNNPHIQVNVDDVAQNFILAVSKAIDKCDSDKGTLTSYIKSWLQDARNTTHFRHDYGLVFSLPTSKRREIARKQSTVNNLPVDMESPEVQNMASSSNVEQELESANVVNTIRRLAKHADPLGLGRLALNITEVLSEEELSLLDSVTQEETQ